MSHLEYKGISSASNPFEKNLLKKTLNPDPNAVRFET